MQRYSEVGQRALAEHRYPEAEQAYEKLRELSPQTAEVHAGLGLIYYQQRKFAQAVPALRQAMKLNPNLPRTDILLALCLSELGQYKEALPGLRKAFKQTADDPLRRLAGLQLTRAYTGLEQDDKAVEVALELTRVYPNDPEILYHSGRLLSNYAYLMTIKLARVAPASAWTHQAAGEANESQGLYEPAIREYREVLSQDPRRPGIHLRIGRTLLARAAATGEEGPAAAFRAEAVKEFEQELALDPTNATAAYELGEIHRRAGELDEAQRLFEAAVAALSRLRGGPARAGARAARRGEGRAGGPSLAQGDRARSGKRGRVLPALAGVPGPGQRGRAAGGAGKVPGAARSRAGANRR